MREDNGLESRPEVRHIAFNLLNPEESVKVGWSEPMAIAAASPIILDAPVLQVRR